MQSDIWNDKRILITGGFGFIGGHLIRHILKVSKPAEIYVIDDISRPSPGWRDVADMVDKRDLMTVSEALDASAVTEDIHGNFDIIIHLAATVGGISTYLNAAYHVLSRNLKADLAALELLDWQEKPCSFLYASSAHVYSKRVLRANMGMLNTVESQDHMVPELSYGFEKLAGEKLIQGLIDEGSRHKFGIARLIGIYGTGMDMNLDSASLIPALTRRAIMYPDVDYFVNSPGHEVRTYCHISDTIDAFEKMLLRMEIRGNVGPYNIGDNKPYTVREISDMIVDISGKSIEVKYNHDNEPFIPWQVCSNWKAKDELLWKPIRSFVDGLREVNWDIRERCK